MKFLVAFALSFLVLGIHSFQLEELEGQIILKATSMVEDFLAPVSAVQRDFVEIYGRTASNFRAKGFRTLSPDDCLALSNTTQIAYNLAVNVTNFAVASVKQVTSSLNTLVSCPSTSILPDRVIKCMFDQLEIVRQEILDTETNFTPYKSLAVQLYSLMVSEIHACVGY